MSRECNSTGALHPQIFGTSHFTPADFEAFSTMCTLWFWGPELAFIEQNAPADPNSWQVFDFFWPPYPLSWHVLPYRNWQKFDIFGLQKHRPLLVNVVCELPLRKANQGVAQYFPLSVFPPLNPFHGQPWHLNECWQSEQNAEVVSLFSLN